MNRAEEIHVSSRSTKDGYWISFENDAYLVGVKSRVHHRCIPCIENLYDQLVEGRQEIQLGHAFNCWKVVVVLNNEEECIRVLRKYEREFLPSRHIQGRFGSKEENGTKAIVVDNIETERERDAFLLELQECVNEANLNAHIFYCKGCAYLYEEVLGDWHEWKKVTPIKYPDKVRDIILKIREVLGIS